MVNGEFCGAAWKSACHRILLGLKMSKANNKFCFSSHVQLNTKKLIVNIILLLNNTLTIYLLTFIFTFILFYCIVFVYVLRSAISLLNDWWWRWWWWWWWRWWRWWRRWWWYITTEHWIQHITFAAETNEVRSHGLADRHTHSVTAWRWPSQYLLRSLRDGEGNNI